MVLDRLSPMIIVFESGFELVWLWGCHVSHRLDLAITLERQQGEARRLVKD
jgi:hypothetical protein